MIDSVHISSAGIQAYTTPARFLAEIEHRFGVNLILDLAASNENKRCIHHLSEFEDSLSVDWRLEFDNIPNNTRGACWLNPPFNKAPQFMAKCAEESAKGLKIITLTLTSLGTKWYKDSVKTNALSLILEDRITFEDQPAPYPKELMVSLWGFGLTGLGWWKR